MARSFHLTVFAGWITLLIALGFRQPGGADASNFTIRIETNLSPIFNGGNASGAGSNTANNNAVAGRHELLLAIALVAGTNMCGVLECWIPISLILQ